MRKTNIYKTKIFPDIQNQTDSRKVSIDKVGVKNIKYPIIVADKHNKCQPTIAEINLFVDLPHHYRGTHMSRFVEVLNQYHKENFIDNLEEILKEIKNRLKADAAYLELSFPYFIIKKAPVSKIASSVNYDCYFRASLKDVFEFWIGVKVPVTTLCPCSKEISDYGAHNQRSIVSVWVHYTEFVWLEDLIELTEQSCSCDIYPLLKRVDEKYVTEKAYDNPMFVEDIVRELSIKLSKDSRIMHYDIEVESYESIHNHNAFAKKSE